MRGFTSALGVSQICAWGVLYYSFPQVADAMGADLSWSKTDLYIAPTLSLVVAGLSAIPVGTAIDRGYGQWVLSLGAIFAGFLLVAWSQVETVVALYVVFVGIGVVSAATLYEAVFAVVVRCNGAEKSRREITLLTLWGGFASTVFIPLIEVLLAAWGWRTSLIFLGLVPLLLCFPLNAYATKSYAERRRSLVRESQSEPGATLGLKWAVGQPTYWALAAVYVTHAAVFSTFTYHAYPLLKELGLETEGVIIVLALIGPAQVAGRLALHIVRQEPSLASLGVGTASVTLLVFVGFSLAPPVFVVLAFFAVLYGAANGIMTIIRGMAVPALLTERSYGRITGSLVMPSMIAKALAPLAAAALWELHKGYDIVLLALVLGSGVLTLSFAIAVFTSRRYRLATNHDSS